MAKKSIRSASSLSRSKATSSSTQLGTPKASTFGNMQVLQYFPQATRRRRSLRPRRPSRFIDKTVEGNINPPVHVGLVDSEPIQSKIKPKLRSKKTRKFKVGVEGEPQDVLNPDTRRIRILADVCYQHLLALADRPSPSDKS